MRALICMLCIFFAACGPKGGGGSGDSTRPIENLGNSSCSIDISVAELLEVQDKIRIFFEQITAGDNYTNCERDQREKFYSLAGASIGMAFGENWDRYEKLFDDKFIDFVVIFIDKRKCTLKNLSEQELSALTHCQWPK